MNPIIIFLHENESFGYFMIVDLVGHSTNLYIEQELYYSLKYGKFDCAIYPIKTQL
jgi:hypothetical protein